MDKKMSRVFIASSSESLHLARALQANLDDLCEVRIWDQGLFNSGNSYLEDLLNLVKEFDFSAVIWSSDDEVTSRGQNYFTPRDNVILEAGMFYSALGRERVFLIRPRIGETKVPSDLHGISHLSFREPSDGNYRAALAPLSGIIEDRIRQLGARNITQSLNEKREVKSFNNIREAWPSLKKDCWEAKTIAILGNRGLGAFGTDQSLVSFAEIDNFSALRKLRIILLSEDSRWLHEGFIQLRAYESIDLFKKELIASHEIAESTMMKLSRRLRNTKSGIRYYLGEPKFGMIITDKVAYINTYANQPSIQVVDLPVYRFHRNSGSLYGAFKRHFDDLWHNESVPGKFQKENIDLETSAGGILLASQYNKKYVALLRRHDGYWVLPKGHRLIEENRLEDTAIREVAEETGLNNSSFYVEKFLGYYAYDEIAEKLNVNKVIHLYLMRCKKNSENLIPELKSPEFAESKWWDITIPLPEMLYAYQQSYLHEVIQVELSNSTE